MAVSVLLATPTPSGSTGGAVAAARSHVPIASSAFLPPAPLTTRMDAQPAVSHAVLYSTKRANVASSRLSYGARALLPGARPAPIIRCGPAQLPVL